MKFCFLSLLLAVPIAAITYDYHSESEKPAGRDDKISKPTRQPVDLSEFQKVCGIRELATSNLARRRPVSVVRKYAAKDTPLENWPWMVKIVQRSEETNGWELLCGGSLITRRYVLTAAHCFSPVPRAVDDYAVHVFSYEARLNSNQDSEAKRIDGISLHPDYNPYLLYNDIAVVRLRVGLEHPYMPVCLPKPQSLYDDLVDRSVVVVGYGSTYDDDLTDALTTTTTTTTESSYADSRNSRVKFHTSTRPVIVNKELYRDGGQYNYQSDESTYGGFTPTTNYVTTTTRRPQQNRTRAPANERTTRRTSAPTRANTQRTTTTTTAPYSSGYADRHVSSSETKHQNTQTYGQRDQSYAQTYPQQQETAYAYPSQTQAQMITYPGTQNQISSPVVYGNQQVQRYRRHLVSKRGGPPSYSLREATITVISSSYCSQMYNKTDRQHLNEGIRESQICAGNPEGGVDSCQGDSGGPLMKQESSGRWTLLGIVSFGNSCAQKGYPGVYSRVVAFNNFIEDAVDFNA